MPIKTSSAPISYLIPDGLLLSFLNYLPPGGIANCELHCIASVSPCFTQSTPAFAWKYSYGNQGINQGIDFRISILPNTPSKHNAYIPPWIETMGSTTFWRGSKNWVPNVIGRMKSALGNLKRRSWPDGKLGRAEEPVRTS